MSLTTPEGLARSLENLGATLAQILGELERLKGRHSAARTRLSHHQHDFSRDITGQPATYPSAAHTHAYAAVVHSHTSYALDTHVHNYEDGQYTLKPEKNVDVSRTTGEPV